VGRSGEAALNGYRPQGVWFASIVSHALLGFEMSFVRGFVAAMAGLCIDGT
jgi:hypothetical protein